jgi:cytochrome c553
MSMRKRAGVCLLVWMGMGAAGVQLQTAGRPLWAFGYKTPPAAPVDYSTRCAGARPADCSRPDALPADAQTAVRRLEGSAGAFTVAQITAGYGPADWFPGDHPPAPDIVARGREAAGLRACASCHLHNGRGLMQTAPLAGLPADYFLRQLADFAGGRRKSSDPNKADAFEMAAIARSLTPAEAKAAADYYGAIGYTKAIRVVESATVPRFDATANGLFLQAEGSQTEPLGRRLIELPENTVETGVLRNPRAGSVAYVPAGSLQRGQQLVTTGGATTVNGQTTPGPTVECRTCHGPDLRGVAGLGPPIAGRSPSYLARQLYDLQNGAREGSISPLMRPTVERLTEDDLIAIAAYVSSLEP